MPGKPNATSSIAADGYLEFDVVGQSPNSPPAEPEQPVETYAQFLFLIHL